MKHQKVEPGTIGLRYICLPFSGHISITVMNSFGDLCCLGCRFPRKKETKVQIHVYCTLYLSS